MNLTSDSRHDPEEEHAAAAERDMRVLERAARLHMAGLDVTPTAVSKAHGYHHRDYTSESLARLVDRGDMVLFHGATLNGSARYRVTPQGFSRVGAVPLWVAA